MTSNQVERLDRLLGLYLRERHQDCGLCGFPLDDTAQVSHCLGRANMATRWDEDNCLLVHDKCHRRWELMTQDERRDFLTRKLGYERYMALSERAVSVKKWTDKEVNELILKFSRTKI